MATGPVCVSCQRFQPKGVDEKAGSGYHLPGQ